MPNKYTTDGNYRYAFQGQEKDAETEMEAFELRLWDGRLGRWLTVDPMGQHFSPYLGMGNNPINRIDLDGGWDDPPTEAGSYVGESCYDEITGNTYEWDGKNWYSDMASGFDLKDIEFIGKKKYNWTDFKWDMYLLAIKAEKWSDGWGKDAGQIIVSFYPPVAIGNAYSGYTTGKDWYDNEMGKGGAAFEAATAIPIVKAVRIVKVVAPSQKVVTPLKKILPTWKKVVIDIDHIVSGHVKGGSRVSSLKSLFPETMSEQQVLNTVRDAYRNVHTKLKTQGERILVRGNSNGIEIEMWINTTTKTIETAYPIY